jgi:hypothetical protein
MGWGASSGGGLQAPALDVRRLVESLHKVEDTPGDVDQSVKQRPQGLAATALTAAQS